MRTTPAIAQQTRAKLLTAAATVIRERGMNSLTLDTIAKVAGVSKGGLLHHFASKEALLEALLQQYFTTFERRIQQYYDQEPVAPGRWLRAYVRATFAEDPADLEIGWLLLISLAETTVLLARVQTIYRHLEAQALQDGLPTARATIIRYAADSYWVECLLNGTPPPAARAALLNELLHLTSL